MSNPTVHQFKITLMDSRPKIWRRLQVPSDYNFQQFHEAIQDAMGWKGHHSYMIRMPRPGSPNSEVTIVPGYMIHEKDSTDLRATTAKIAKFFTEQNTDAVYEYDLGDSWEHSIVFEKTVQIRDHKPFPRCPAGVRGGKNACPPEDAGGIPGFENLCEIIADPKHEEYGEMMEWLESSGYENYDPTFFDPKAIEFRNSVFYGWGLDE